MAPRRLAALGLALALLLSGCTYSREEPGLFRVRTPGPPVLPSPDDPLPRPPVGRGNPALPVAGEVVWTTGERAQVDVRFAVHAVRRIVGATVLDFSVTPLSAPGLSRGDDLPGLTDLGLGTGSGDLRVWLLDPVAGRVYPSLQHVDEAQFRHCLCSPLWATQPDLRIGESRLLEVTFGPLPEGVGNVDVALANVAPVVHVPVTSVGEVPQPRQPVDLRRPASPAAAAGEPLAFPLRVGREAGATFSVDAVLSSPGLTSLAWTIRSDREGFDHLGQDLGAPLAAPVPDGVEVAGSNPVSGPVLRPPGSDRALPVSWMTRQVNGRPALQCLCSELGLGARALEDPGGVVHGTSLYAALPAGTRRVEVVLPGVGSTTVRVDPAPDGARRLGPPVAADPRSWIYSTDSPPRGWDAAAWPTPLPDPWQLVDYRSSVERVTTLSRP